LINRALIVILLSLFLVRIASADSPLDGSSCLYTRGDSSRRLSRDYILRIELRPKSDQARESLTHLRLKLPERPYLPSDSSPSPLDRFYFYAYRYSANANLISVQMPESNHYETLPYRWIRNHNEPQMESILRSALGRAAGEYFLNDDFDRDTRNWALAPSTTAEGFRQRFRPGMRFNVRGSIEGAGAGVRYNIAGLSLATDYTTQNQSLAPLRVSRPFSAEAYRGELGMDIDGNLWLNLIGRW
jgi:hypothetical protein